MYKHQHQQHVPPHQLSGSNQLFEPNPGSSLGLDLLSSAPTVKPLLQPRCPPHHFMPPQPHGNDQYVGTPNQSLLPDYGTGRSIQSEENQNSEEPAQKSTGLSEARLTQIMESMGLHDGTAVETQLQQMNRQLMQQMQQVLQEEVQWEVKKQVEVVQEQLQIYKRSIALMSHGPPATQGWNRNEETDAMQLSVAMAAADHGPHFQHFPAQIPTWQQRPEQYSQQHLRQFSRRSDERQQTKERQRRFQPSQQEQQFEAKSCSGGDDIYHSSTSLSKLSRRGGRRSRGGSSSENSLSGYPPLSTRRGGRRSRGGSSSDSLSVSSDGSSGGDHSSRSSDSQLGRDRNARKQENCTEDFEKLAVNVDHIVSGEDTRTTLMVTKIPKMYTQSMLISQIEECEEGRFRGKFDFFYLPMDLKNKRNFGYHFINFISTEELAAFVSFFSGRAWDRFNSGKVCIINYARIQGLRSLIENFAKSKVLRTEAPCNQPIIWLRHDNGSELKPMALGLVSEEESRRITEQEDVIL